MGYWFKHYKAVHEYEDKIDQLKKKAKAQPFGACAILMNHDGKILLGKRKNGFKSSYYGLPDGRVEINEPIAQAIHREAAEETGLQLNTLTYLGVIRENQDTYDFIHFVYLAKNITEEPTLCEPNKCEGWEWMDPKSIKQPILPGHLAAIELYQKNIKILDLTKSV